MKALALNQMEQIEGGWSWGKCAGGAAASITSGGASYAVEWGGLLFGPVGALAAGVGTLAATCALANT